MMEFREALEKLESSEAFKRWHQENKESYLSHAFIMVDDSVKEEWQIGYASPKDEKITTFDVSEKILKNPESEAFKDEKKILPLHVKKVKLTLKDALLEADKLQKEKYSAHSAFKKIVILQNLELGQVWNITYVTNTFKTLNMKFDAETGKVLKHELIDFFRVDK